VTLLWSDMFRRGQESRRSSLSYLHRLRAVVVVIASGCFTPGCVAVGDELELSSRDPAEDQRLIAERYSEEALRFYQKAEEAEARAAIYADLFGVDSDWVKSTRLLAQSYRDAARQRERVAADHAKLAGKTPASKSFRSE
jgi:hypothetical protein